MHESDTYLAVIDEGREAQVKKNILLLGTERFGAPNPTLSAQLQAISDLERLERTIRRLLKVSNWQDLLDTP